MPRKLSTPISKDLSIRRFGEKLHALRTLRGLTLKELAYALGYVAHGHLSELEAGKKLPTAEFVLKVADLFDVTTDQLLRDEIDLDLEHADKD
jgi:transcriptional regulator with XRE-family HTH domain